jgi:hypothetical protein
MRSKHGNEDVTLPIASPALFDASGDEAVFLRHENSLFHMVLIIWLSIDNFVIEISYLRK